MEAKRVLVVEPDAAFGLSLAGLFRADGCATAVAGSAADAEREIAARPPDLVVVRAELPDLSGFSLCGRLRRERPGLPLILLSSDATAEALAEHARTPGSAQAYLSMPVDTAALARAARDLLAAPAPLEVADDAVVDRAPPVEVRVGAPAPAQASLTPSPPPVPRRARRSEVTDEDRLFLERTFQSIADRRADLVAEARRRRPPPPRQLLATPEGRLALLREDLKAREAQIARLAQIWEARDRDLAGADARLHEKEVELQSAKLRVDELLRKLAEARDLLVARDREHGASVEGLLLERFSQEKDLIEVVAGKERRVAELEREVRQRDEDLARRREALDGAARELVRLEAEGQRWREACEEAARRAAALERELSGRGGAPAPGGDAPGGGGDPDGGARGG
jgi:ParB family chromosome partitioning protein